MLSQSEAMTFDYQILSNIAKVPGQTLAETAANGVRLLGSASGYRGCNFL